MRGRMKGWATMTAAMALAGIGMAQEISVNVNGQPVMFNGVGPQQVNGRVMVPLRGVMEKLGAYVGYDAATRTVTATRGDIDLQLRLGQRVATLNGREVTLDVPAMEYRGSTLVPLRFMGEALGADVRWDGAAQAVNISTSDTHTGRPLPIDPTLTTSAPAQITSFRADREGYLRTGGEITYTLEGTPGGIATLQIPGVTTGDIPMREVSPGHYEAVVRVPNTGSVTVNQASAIARLRSGNSEKLIQSGSALSVDTEVPKILENSPATGTRTSNRQPNITASLDDSGSGIATDRVRILLDGRDVTADASVTGTFLAYRPPSPLSPGPHQVQVTVEDRAGNQTRRTWTFDIGQRSNVIRSFTSDAGTNPEPGQVVRFTLTGEAGGTASLSIGDQRRDIPMREVSPGRYEAEYTVRRNDDFENQAVVATLRTREGETYNTEPRTDLIGPRDRAVRRPTITSPTQDAQIADQFRITGTGPRNGRVRIRVDYKASLLGLLGTGGTLSEQTVDVDDQGRFESQPIRISGFAGGRGTTYTITVTAINRNGKESEPVTITTRR